jgi:hypothetical protein
MLPDLTLNEANANTRISCKCGESNQNLLNKPAEVKTQVNKALDATEKARQNALTEPKN